MSSVNPRLCSGVVCLIAIVFLALLSSCSDDPTGTVRGAVDLDGEGQVDPNGEADFFLGATSIDGTADGRVDVWAHNLTVESENIVSFDVVLANKSRHVIFPPVLFFITKLIPEDVAVLNPDIETIIGPGGFDFSDDLGDDNVLDPGEQTAPVNMRFWLPEMASFAIGFRIEAGVPPSENTISGVVFNDFNRNAERDSNEPGLAGIKVQLTGTQEGTDPFEFIAQTTTDDEGRYGFPHGRAGIYEVTAIFPSGWLETTPNPLIVTLVEDSSGVIPITGVDFGVLALEPPPPPIPAVFGPVLVGPASPAGTQFEDSFTVRAEDPPAEYVLTVVPPPILGAVLMRVDLAKVWINEEAVFEFECMPDTVCVPYEHVDIAPGLIIAGANAVNAIRIIVEGNEFAVLSFAIFRKEDLPD